MHTSNEELAAEVQWQQRRDEVRRLVGISASSFFSVFTLLVG